MCICRREDKNDEQKCSKIISLHFHNKTNFFPRFFGLNKMLPILECLKRDLDHVELGVSPQGGMDGSRIPPYRSVLTTFEISTKLSKSFLFYWRYLHCPTMHSDHAVGVRGGFLSGLVPANSQNCIYNFAINALADSSSW